MRDVSHPYPYVALSHSFQAADKSVNDRAHFQVWDPVAVLHTRSRGEGPSSVCAR